MIPPLELLNLAQSLAARIPRTPEYSEERNASWLSVGTACVCLDDIAGAKNALENLDNVRAQAQLRLELGNWVGGHTASETGRSVLRETLAGFSSLEPHLSRKDVTDLVPSVFKTFGVEGVHLLARQLEDPFTAGNVYVTLSYCLSDDSPRREQLLLAERLATTVREGDRDYALRWVYSGYKTAGLSEDMDRVRRMASVEPMELTAREEALFENIDKYLPQAPPDTPKARLRRVLDYGRNDLKVIFLTDSCVAGGISDPEMEAQIRSNTFEDINGARAMELYGDSSSLDSAGFACFLFGRPVCQHPADRALLEGKDRCDRPDSAVFVRQLTSLFRDFGMLAKPFSAEQVEQGLWFVLGHPFWLVEKLADEEVSEGLRAECLRSMVSPFRDYYHPNREQFLGSAFFMWWDCLLDRPSVDRGPELEAILIEVLRQILQLPSKECQFAALHGLNHMHPSSAAAETVRQYLEGHRTELTSDEISWVEACGTGATM
jgi:hypothetical protein